ncbi:substrate-binding periplasmic protein [Duganella callida]|uniref:substrate-binding periplasmic protein n=1 Tax=Duganella callida TaxID=2561932 RepID=UPI001430FEA6|nr:transporter substrate-binding domain-containing protein [Duganella callida]
MLPLAARAADTITLTSGEWQPYISEKLPHYGPLTRIITEAFALEGVQVRYVFRPWNRAFIEGDSGGANGTILWSESGPGLAGERERRYHYSDVVFEGQSVFFHLKRYPFRWTSFDRLAGVRMGGTAGYDYLFAGHKDITIDRTAPSDELNFRKLAAGRFDVFPADLNAGREIMRTTLTPEQAALITWDPRPFNTTRYHLLLNRRGGDNERYLALFNRGLKKLKDSGKYAEYLQTLK